MKKVLIIALFANVLNVSAHLPDSLINLVTDQLFDNNYVSVELPVPEPYKYSYSPGMNNSDTVFFVTSPGTYKMFIEPVFNAKTQYQIDIIVEPRPVLLKTDKKIINSGKNAIIIKRLKAKKEECN